MLYQQQCREQENAQKEDDTVGGLPHAEKHKALCGRMTGEEKVLGNKSAFIKIIAQRIDKGDEPTGRVEGVYAYGCNAYKGQKDE